MEREGAGAEPPPGGEPDRRRVYLEDVAKEFDSWLFWRDADGAVDTVPTARHEPGYQVVTAHRVQLGETTARLAAPEANAARCRIPSPTEELLAESRQRLQQPAGAAIGSDSRLASGAASCSVTTAPRAAASLRLGLWRGVRSVHCRRSE